MKYSKKYGELAKIFGKALYHKRTLRQFIDELILQIKIENPKFIESVFRDAVKKARANCEPNKGEQKCQD